jgi:hypothetical protein
MNSVTILPVYDFASMSRELWPRGDYRVVREGAFLERYAEEFDRKLADTYCGTKSYRVEKIPLPVGAVVQYLGKGYDWIWSDPAPEDRFAFDGHEWAFRPSADFCNHDHSYLEDIRSLEAPCAPAS